MIAPFLGLAVLALLLAAFWFGAWIVSDWLAALTA